MVQYRPLLVGNNNDSFTGSRSSPVPLPLAGAGSCQQLTVLELGTGFAFVGSQYHIEFDDEDYFLDLLFYHLKLRCYVIIDLMRGKFKPE